MTEKATVEEIVEADGRPTLRRARQALPVLMSGHDDGWEVVESSTQDRVETLPRHINEGRVVRTITIVVVGPSTQRAQVPR